MASLNMRGPFPLTDEEVNNRVEEGRMGNYAYGYIDESGQFVVMYVGRSDLDLHERIGHGIEEFAKHPEYRYECFKFSYATTAQEAYEKECRNYHDFGGEDGSLVNAVHPAKPEGTPVDCPVCGNSKSMNYLDFFN